MTYLLQSTGRTDHMNFFTQETLAYTCFHFPGNPHIIVFRIRLAKRRVSHFHNWFWLGWASNKEREGGLWSANNSDEALVGCWRPWPDNGSSELVNRGVNRKGRVQRTFWCLHIVNTPLLTGENNTFMWTSCFFRRVTCIMKQKIMAIHECKTLYLDELVYMVRYFGPLGM